MEIIPYIYYVTFVILIAVFVSVIWPTIGLIAFLSIYLLKPLLRLYVPFLVGFWGYLFDMGVAIIAFIGILAYHFRFVEKKEKLLPVYVWICLLLLAVWVWIRLPVSRNPEYGLIKALVFSIFDMITILLGIMYAKTINKAKIVIKALVVIGVCTVVGLLVFGRPAQDWQGSRITLGYSTPLVPADFAIYLIIISINYWLAKGKGIYIIAALLTVPLTLITILLTGTRGSLFALPLILFVLFYFYKRTLRMKLPIYLFISILAGLGTISYIGSEAVVANRMNRRAIETGLDERIILTKIAFMGWLRSPILGNGTGDTSVQINENFTMVRYPHNLILEVVNEFGIFGLIPLLILLYGGFKSFKYLSSNIFENKELKECFVPFFGCFLYHFLISFKTGSYAGSNMFYFFLGIVISITELGKQRISELTNLDTSLTPKELP